MPVLRYEKMERYMSWRAQLVRALARKTEGPGSSPGPRWNFSFQILNLANRWPSSENEIFHNRVNFGNVVILVNSL